MSFFERVGLEVKFTESENYRNEVLMTARTSQRWNVRDAQGPKEEWSVVSRGHNGE